MHESPKIHQKLFPALDCYGFYTHLLSPQMTTAPPVAAVVFVNRTFLRNVVQRATMHSAHAHTTRNGFQHVSNIN